MDYNTLNFNPIDYTCISIILGVNPAPAQLHTPHPISSLLLIPMRVKVGSLWCVMVSHFHLKGKPWKIPSNYQSEM